MTYLGGTYKETTCIIDMKHTSSQRRNIIINTMPQCRLIRVRKNEYLILNSFWSRVMNSSILWVSINWIHINRDNGSYFIVIFNKFFQHLMITQLFHQLHCCVTIRIILSWLFCIVKNNELKQTFDQYSLLYSNLATASNHYIEETRGRQHRTYYTFFQTPPLRILVIPEFYIV